MSKAKTDLSVEFIRAILDYDPIKGVLRWKKRPDISTRADRKNGHVAGFKNKDGHLVIQIQKRRYPAHRLIWVLVYGHWPNNDIDHIDGNRSNNKLANLRAATRRENLRNMGKKPFNKSGYKWVSWHKPTNKWVAQVRNNKTNVYLGVFNSPQKAHKRACGYARQIHGIFVRTK